MRPRRGARSLSKVGALGLGLGVAVVSGAVVYMQLQRRRERTLYTLSQWNACKAEDGSIRDFDAILQQITEQGLDLGARKEIWPYLLGVYKPTARADENEATHDATQKAYEILLEHCKELEAALQIHLGAEAAAAAAQAVAAEADRVAAAAAAAQSAAVAAQALQERLEQLAAVDPSAAADGTAGGTAGGTGLDSGSFTMLAAAEVPYYPSGPPVTLRALTPRTSLPNSHAAADAAGGGAGGGDARPAGDGGGGAAGGSGRTSSSGRHGGAGGGGDSDTAKMLAYCDCQRMVVMDAIRSDFSKNSLTKVDELKSWWQSTLADNSVYQNLTRSEEWWRPYWLSTTARQALDHASQYSSEQKRQLARLINLLSVYAMHDPETGYCQGMSDLALPFLMLMDDDITAFWCFEHLMRKIRKNFAIDESGIFLQLAELGSLLQDVDGVLHYRLKHVGAINCHFAYRMIVVLMRRELPLDQALRLWEMCWADDSLNRWETIETHAVASANAAVNVALGHSRAPSMQSAPLDEARRGLFSYFVAAVVVKQREKLLNGCTDSDDIIKHFQTLRVNMWECVALAQELRLRRLGDDAPLHQRRKAAAAAEVPVPPAAANARTSGSAGHHHHLQVGGAFSPSEERGLMGSDDDEAGSPSSFGHHGGGGLATSFGALAAALPPPPLLLPGLQVAAATAVGTSAAAAAAPASASWTAPPSPLAPAPSAASMPVLQRLQFALTSAFVRAPSSDGSKPLPLPAPAPTADLPPLLFPPPPPAAGRAPPPALTASRPGFVMQAAPSLMSQPAPTPVAPSPPPPPAAQRSSLECRHHDDDEDDEETEGRPLLG